jgi:hypothetical protein
MIKKYIVGLFVLMAVLFAAENSFAQARPVPGQMGGLLGVGSPQSNNLYYQNGGSYFGRITAYPGSHFQIDLGNGGEIKTYRNSCRQINSGGYPGVYCTFGQFKYGQLTYSGDTVIYQNGMVYLRWLYEFNGNQQRTINGSWYGFRP